MKNLVKTGYMAMVSLIFLLASGCGISENIEAKKQAVMAIQDPTERGLAYIAIAILLAGLMRAIYNK